MVKQKYCLLPVRVLEMDLRRTTWLLAVFQDCHGPGRGRLCFPIVAGGWRCESPSALPLKLCTAPIRVKTFSVVSASSLIRAPLREIYKGSSEGYYKGVPLLGRLQSEGDVKLPSKGRGTLNSSSSRPPILNLDRNPNRREALSPNHQSGLRCL